MKIRSALTIAVLSASLAGCGVVDLISKGLAYSKAVESDLKQATGIKPEVGFKWHNGYLQSVTVSFPRLYTDKPLDEFASTVREVVAREFKETPATILLEFELKK